MRKEDDLDLFLNGANFMQSEITSYAVHKDDFVTSYAPEGISFSSLSMNIRALAKILIPRTGIFFPLVLWNNFRRLYI